MLQMNLQKCVTLEIQCSKLLEKEFIMFNDVKLKIQE